MHPFTRSGINDILTKAAGEPRLTDLEAYVINGLLDRGQFKIDGKIDFTDICESVIDRRAQIKDLTAEAKDQPCVFINPEIPFPSVSATLRMTANPEDVEDDIIKNAKLISASLIDRFDGRPNTPENRAAMEHILNRELTRIYEEEAPSQYHPYHKAYVEKLHEAIWDGLKGFIPPEMVMNPPKKDYVSPMAHLVNSAIGRGYGLPIEGITPEEFAQAVVGLIKS